MRTFVTIHEPAVERALDAIAGLPEGLGVEVRADAMGDFAFDRLAAFRNATVEALLFTRRSTPDHPQQPLTAAEIGTIFSAGFDLVDVEWPVALDLARYGDRIVLSHHDFEGLPAFESLIAEMAASGARAIKIAATPRSFRDDLAILDALDRHARRSLTLFGMGARGLYSRILAPFFGSEMTFVARDASSVAAPGQLTIDQAIQIYGDALAPARPRALFAVAGNPARHSLSPKIHNRIFRDERLPAAYAIVEPGSIEEVIVEMLSERRFAPMGVSITAPFKEEAYRCAEELGPRATIGSNARRCGAVNTFVRFRDGSGELRAMAENTDVDGFESGLSRAIGESERELRAAVIGAGGTARAALVAAEDLDIRARVYNRTIEKGAALGRTMGVEAAPLEALAAFDGEIVINTTTAGSAIALPDALFAPGRLFIDVAYAPGTTALAERARAAGTIVVDGYDLLVAQARRQSKLFIDTIHAMETRAKC